MTKRLIFVPALRTIFSCGSDTNNPLSLPPEKTTHSGIPNNEERILLFGSVYQVNLIVDDWLFQFIDQVIKNQDNNSNNRLKEILFRKVD